MIVSPTLPGQGGMVSLSRVAMSSYRIGEGRASHNRKGHAVRTKSPSEQQFDGSYARAFQMPARNMLRDSHGIRTALT